MLISTPVGLILVAVLAFAFTYALVPVSMAIATKLGAIDEPSERRVHKDPTPRMGGIAIFGGIMGALAIAFILHKIGLAPTLDFPDSFNTILIAISIVVIFAVGAIDDVVQIHPWVKLLGQIIASCIAVAGGVLLTDIHSGAADLFVAFGIWAYPITVFYLVAFANIINLIDGLDGLAAGVAAITGAAFLVLSCQLNIWATATMAAALVASCIAFLRFNFNPAKLFMGDCGSLTLGFILGMVSLMGTMRVSSITSLAVPVVIAAIPVLDTFAAIIRRKRSHVPVGSPDKQHLHHSLLKMGFSQKRVVLTIYAICAIFAISGVVIAETPLWVRIVVIIVDLLIAAFLVWKLGLFGKVMGRYYPDGLPRNFWHDLGNSAEKERQKPNPFGPTKILFVAQHYWPEPFNSTEICEGLVERGYDVTVLTGQPNYPEGEIYSGYEDCAVTSEEHNGVHILRCKLHPRKQNVFHRVWNYYSFSTNASALAKDLDAGFEIVYSYQTSPVMMANPAIVYSRKHDVPLLIHVVDIWPACLTAGGFTDHGPVYRYFKNVSRIIYNSADKIAVTSDMFIDYLRDSVGVDMDDPVVIPQFAEDAFMEFAEHVDSIRDEDFPKDKINIMFAGNIGTAQSVDTAIKAASYLKDEPFMFHIVGSGSELEACKDLCEAYKLTNVTFHGRHPIEEMPAYYNKADAMLATFANKPVLAYTLPRKIQSYMAAGKPVIGTILGAARNVINDAQCGLFCDAEDPIGLARACREFAAFSDEERRLMGMRGRRYYEQHFSRNSFFEKIEIEFDKMKGMKHGN